MLVKYREELTRPLQEAKDFMRRIESQLNMLSNGPVRIFPSGTPFFPHIHIHRLCHVIDHDRKRENALEPKEHKLRNRYWRRDGFGRVGFCFYCVGTDSSIVRTPTTLWISFHSLPLPYSYSYFLMKETLTHLRTGRHMGLRVPVERKP